MATKSKQSNMCPSYGASTTEADNNSWARSFNYHNTLEQEKTTTTTTTSVHGSSNNSITNGHESIASGGFLSVRLGSSSVTAAGSLSPQSRDQSTIANLMVPSDSSLVDTPPATPFLPAAPTPHSSTPIRKRLSFPLAPITDLFISSSHRRRPSLTPSQTAQISSPVPTSNSRPSTTGGLGARSRSRSTSATQATEPILLTTSIGSSPPSTLRYSGMPIAMAGPSMRMAGGGIPGELIMRSIGEGALSMDEDSPTDSHYRNMPYGRTVREMPEDISEDGEWEGDFESKRSRASTLSSPASVTGVLGGSFAGLRRKISDSKRIMKPLSPESTHADLRIIRNQPRAITPSSGFRSPASGHTSDDDDMDDDSVISGFGSRSLGQGAITYSHSRTTTRRQPPPLDLHTSSPATLTVRCGKIMTMNPSSSASSLQMQSRSQSVPPKQLMEIGPSPISNNPGKPSTSSGPGSRNLEIPGDMTGNPSFQAARLSSLNQAPSSGQLTQQNRSISTTAISSIARSDSNSSSGTNNTNSIISLATTSSNANHPSPAVPSQQLPATQQVQAQNKYLTTQDRKSSSKVSLAASARLQKGQSNGSDMRNPNLSSMPRSSQPPFPDPNAAPKVAPAPASGMYWYKAPEYGQQRLALRAHTCTMVGSSIYVFGGCDRVCYNDMHVFDTDSMSWSKPTVYGDIPPPLRAMTTTAVGKKLVIFGGGDGPTYYNDVYVFDTTTNRYTKPVISGDPPSKRRAHTACFYRNGIYIFGGGDGERALDDVWRLDVSDFSKLFWKCICPPTSGPGSVPPRIPANTSTTSLSAKIRKNGPTASPSLDGSSHHQQRPTARGYHTANMVGAKLIVYGGSDGQECFRDVWVFDVDTEIWKLVPMEPPPPAGSTPPPPGGIGGGKVSFQRLSHTATIVGSYLFVVGGHDGVEYSSEVLLLNLVTMQWDKRKVYGQPPTGRGYHGAVLHDSRVFVIGGFDGQSVFADTYVLELAVSSYFSQISHFSIEV